MDAAEAGDGVVGAGGGEFFGDHGEFEGAGDVDDVDGPVRDAGVTGDLECAIEEALGEVLGEAGDGDGDVEAGAVLGSLGCAWHWAYPKSGMGCSRMWPILSRLAVR